MSDKAKKVRPSRKRGDNGAMAAEQRQMVSRVIFLGLGLRNADERSEKAFRLGRKR